MIKTVVTPESNDLHVYIPDSYIGKEIEVLLYSKDELVQTPGIEKKPWLIFPGFFPKMTFQSLKDNSEKARKEWNRAI